MVLAGAVARNAAGQDAGTAVGAPLLGLVVAATLAEALRAPSDVVVDYTRARRGEGARAGGPFERAERGDRHHPGWVRRTMLKSMQPHGPTASASSPRGFFRSPLL